MCRAWGQFGGGHGGRVLPTFSGGSDIICDIPPLFLFRFCFWRSSKNKSDVCHVLCEVLILLDVTYSQVDVETEFGVVLLDSVSLSFNKMIFSVFQVSRDRERWFTASVRHFTLYSILLERLFS